MERLEGDYVVAGVTPQECWDYVTDPDHGTEWNTFAKEVRALDPPGLGRRIETRIGFVGITFGLTATVSTYDEPGSYALTSTVPFEAILGMGLTPEGDGTRVRSFLQIEPGKFFPVPKIVLRKALKLQFDKDSKNLRKHLAALAF